MVLGPIFEKEFSPTSYGFRPGLGCKDALREVDQLLKEDCTWVVDADVRSYFDTIPHDLLINRIREKVSNGYKMIRYADHWAVLCRSLAEAQAALSLIQSWISQNGLQLSPEKTHIGNSHKTGHG